jgi:hypothetical protein
LHQLETRELSMEISSSLIFVLSLKCVCGNSLAHVTRWHIATHINKSKESFPCDKCSFVGLNKRSSQYHQKKHEGKTYFCGKCNYFSSTKAQLQSHVNSKHGELKLKCEFCDYKFPCNWKLKQHTERRHTSFKPVRSNYGKGKKGSSEDKQPLYPKTDNDDSTLISEVLVKITSGES